MIIFMLGVATKLVSWVLRLKSVLIIISLNLISGIELYETAGFPSRVHDEKIKGKKIVDFSIGENISVFLTGTLLLLI
jgi:hypothetical protein